MTIFWAGDSTVQTNNFSTYPQTGIGQVFNIFIKPEIIVANHAVNGRSTKSFMDEGRLLPIKENIGAGDFLFVQFGHNDEKINDHTRYTEPYGDYSTNLQIFAETAFDRNAHPVFITPLTRRVPTDNPDVAAGEHLPYVEALKATAERIKVPVIDLYYMSCELISDVGLDAAKEWYMHVEKGKYPAYTDGLSDNTHLTYEGAVMFGRLIAKGLKELGGIYGDLIADDVAAFL